MRADLHLHTEFSNDSLVDLESLIKVGAKRRLGCVAVTDHNTTAGAMKLQQMNPPFQVIVGEEISTKDGEIIALFLQEEIVPGLGVMETLDLIRAQEALAMLPHPCDRLRHHVIIPDMIFEVTSAIDLVEGFNGRTVFGKAVSLGRSYGKPLTAGSDAHTPWEIGNCGMEIRPFDGPRDFLRAVQEGKRFGHHSAAWVHVVTKMVKFKNRRDKKLQ